MFVSSNESTSTTERDQLSDSMTVARNGEGLPMLNSVHDLLGSVAQVTLSDLGLHGHSPIVPSGAIWCYRVTGTVRHLVRLGPRRRLHPRQ